MLHLFDSSEILQLPITHRDVSAQLLLSRFSTSHYILSAMKLQALLLANTFSIPHSKPHFRIRQSFPFTKPPFPLPFLRRNTLHFDPICSHLSHTFLEAVRFDGPVMEIGDISETEDGNLIVETCVTRNLPSALTLERGLQSINENVEELKLNPPCTPNGIFRFQVAVPPSAKALNWFCSQPESSSVYPLFFVSKSTEDPDPKLLYLKETKGVFGIGASVYFTKTSSSTSGERSEFKRYISNESSQVMAYGFVDINFDQESSSVKREPGSYYFFIPQIELDEYEGISILAVTIAWCDSSPFTFVEAIDSFESAFHQVSCHFLPWKGISNSKRIISSHIKLSMVDEKAPPMRTINNTKYSIRAAVNFHGFVFPIQVFVNTFSSSGKYIVNGITELVLQKEALSSRQFCIRISSSIVVASNMLVHESKAFYSVQDCANINTVWASLIIEECCRLGLTYFCIAPGSRSSPLAVAASSHPLITCIACFDERSLAFHAVGYARGSHKPAVVITSSGTAVSNLLPAVVEAYQDFVPLLLLTADRPAELQDAGANQSINQINHFGSFVRFFFSLPAPNDYIPARMALTTVDSAVHWATNSSPCGPVHINCPFREPLENSPRKWMLNCLEGLDRWMSSTEPFTKYINLQDANVWNDIPSEIAEVSNLIRNTDKGLLLVGGVRTEDEMWAILLLARHLSWPVVADILSGLRLRKLSTSFPEIKDFLFVDHLDHALLSSFVRGWMHVDVVLQIGSRITSKRVTEMLKECFPKAYIMVHKHPFRHDPSHIVTHRIQSNVVNFADYLIKVDFPCKSHEWSTCLHAVNMMVEKELSFQICAENVLNEPQVARIISEALSTESALFIGNSMAIRDADMYGSGWSYFNQGASSVVLPSELPCHLIQVAGNRGASGIDGLLSTAIGFAVGCNKRVFCVIGDISFLHDTNGLTLLNQRMLRKPMTILLINNHGGAIFSLLPIADRVESSILNRYFYTSHNVSIRGLCEAHGILHLGVKSKLELHNALFRSQNEEMDCIIEVDSSIDFNATVHSVLRKFAILAADHALNVVLGLSVQNSISDGSFLCKVLKMEYSVFRLPLCSPHTMVGIDSDNNGFYREGFILALSLEDGSIGFGEVSPLNLHGIDFIRVEEQLRFLLHVMRGARISCFVPLLKGSFSSWIWTELGIPPSSLLPSVRCGLEMAILNALAARQGSDFLSILQPSKDEINASKNVSKVKICALVDSNGKPNEVADLVTMIVEEGFTAIKLKVARTRNPMHDAEVIQEVRKKVGDQVDLRADANRNWTYKEAVQFGSLVKDCNLQYIEEPVSDEADIIKFCEETGLPVALDETIADIQDNLLNMPMKYTHPGIVAIVIKPGVVGGFENAALIANWAHRHGKMAVLSSVFESGLGLSTYIQFSCYIEQKRMEMCETINYGSTTSIAHGLGTYHWLKEDIAVTPLNINRSQCSGFVEASIFEASQFLQTFQVNCNVILRNFTREEICIYQLPIGSNGFSCAVKVQEIGQRFDDNVVVFLHGFLGTSEDWIPLMKTLSGSSRCISVDLPGHGETKVHTHGHKDLSEDIDLSIEAVAGILYKLLHHLTPRKVTIIGYSMGARIALYMALKFVDKVKGAAVISGSPGLKDVVERKIRRAKDESRARNLVACGLHLFLDSWYAGNLWISLRGHPQFNKLVASRLCHKDVKSLAKVLSDSSIGRQLPLWDDLKYSKAPLLFIVGEKDRKFKRIAEDMCNVISNCGKKGDDSTNDTYKMVEIPNSGHAVHLENPLAVISVLRQFLTSLE